MLGKSTSVGECMEEGKTGEDWIENHHETSGKQIGQT
jgi:hypothetical protein